MATGPSNYFQINAGSCNYGAITGIRSQLYDLYTQARKTANFNLEDIFVKYPTPAGQTPVAFQELYVSDADNNPDFFTRVESFNNVLQPMYECYEMAKRFGLDRLKAIGENWLGQLHSTGSFEVNSCAYQANGVLVASQWYAFEVTEQGENFKVVWVDYGYVDLKGSSAVEFQSEQDGKIICDQRSFRA